MVIAVDFDGTISASRYPDVGEAMPGAIEGMQALKKLGCYLILWTCRTGKPLEDALIWLNSVGIEVDRVNTQEPGRLLQYGYTRKVDADLYVDDKVVGGFPGWKAVEEYIESLIVQRRCGIDV